MVNVQTDGQLISKLLDSQPDSVVWYYPVFDATKTGEEQIIDFELKYCNNAAAKLFKEAASMTIGDRISTAVLLDHYFRQQLLEQCTEVWETGKPVELTSYQAGMDRYFNIQRSKVQNGILCIIRDRTHEIKKELERLNQEKKYHQMLDASGDGMLLLEAIRSEEGAIIDFRIVYCNKAGFEFGKLPATAIGKSILQVLPHMKGHDQMRLHQQVIETGQPVRFETTFKSQDGTEYGWFMVSLTRFGDAVVSCFTEITAVRKAQLQLEESAQKLQTIINTSQAGFFLASPVYDAQEEIIDFQFTMVNHVLAAFTQKHPDELIGQLGSVLFMRYKTNGLFEQFKDTFLTGNKHQFDFHYIGAAMDVWANIMTAKMGDELLVTFTDFTPIKRLQLQLESSVEELKRSNTNLEEFAYAASHDLQEPLRKISVFSDRLKKELQDILTAENFKMFERMEAATVRMRNLINDLLTYSKVTAKPNTVAKVDLNKIVQHVLHDFETTIHDTNANITVAALPVIQGDKLQLQQLFQNLVGNALKYHQPGIPANIAIYTYQHYDQDAAYIIKEELEGTYCHLVIADKGIGFEQENADKIFQIFQRLHGRSEYEGTGIGLAIVQKVIINHKGFIEVESEPGVGTRFHIYLPL